MRPIRILSVDGGGIGGVCPARIITNIVARFPDFLSQVDLFAGTSTGGLIALALAGGMSPADLCDAYLEWGPKIFARNEERLASQWWRAKYDPAGLAAAVEAMIGVRTVGDLRGNVFVPTTVVRRDDSDNGSVPAMLAVSTAWRLFGNRNLQSNLSDEWLASRAAMATCAAPTFFPAYDVIAGYLSYTLIDGGMVRNNPAGAAYAEVSRLAMLASGGTIDDPNPDVRILSLGTGLTNSPINAGDWGPLQWAGPVSHVMLAAAVDQDALELRQNLGSDAVRVNPPMPAYQIDDASVMPELDRLAAAWCESSLRKVEQPDGAVIDLVDWLERNWA